MKRTTASSLLVLVVVLLACSRGDKPLATFGTDSLTPTEYIEELDFFLEETQTLADVGVTPEAFLDRAVRFRILSSAAERSTPRLGPRDTARLAAYRERLLQQAMVEEAFADGPPVEAGSEEYRRRLSLFEEDLLRTASFAPDTSLHELMALRLGAFRDSVVREGVDLRSAGAPRFSGELEARVLFQVMGSGFPLGVLVAELSASGMLWMPQVWTSETALALSRRRALSAILDEISRQKGYMERPDIRARVVRKRRELTVNTLLRELWRGSEPTEEDLTELRVAPDGTVRDSVAVRQLADQLVRQRQAQRLDEYINQLSAQMDVQFFPERLDDAIARFEAMRRERAAGGPVDLSARGG